MIIPDWPAPENVQSLVTTRNVDMAAAPSVFGGMSQPPYDRFNLGDHVGDDQAAVAANRACLRKHCPAEPVWLKQVHGTAVVTAGVALGAADAATGTPEADASVAFTPNRVCVVLTADCLPVLFCNRDGSVVAAAHAGWRGLAAGVLESTVTAMQTPPQEILAWLGPAIGSAAFEVGDEVRAAFVNDLADTEVAFRATAPGKWLADIYMLARMRLARAGVKAVYGGGFCTYTDAARFYSYRRDKQTGRMASLIWLK